MSQYKVQSQFGRLLNAINCRWSASSRGVSSVPRHAALRPAGVWNAAQRTWLSNVLGDGGVARRGRCDTCTSLVCVGFMPSPLAFIGRTGATRKQATKQRSPGAAPPGAGGVCHLGCYQYPPVSESRVGRGGRHTPLLSRRRRVGPRGSPCRQRHRR